MSIQYLCMMLHHIISRVVQAFEIQVRLLMIMGNTLCTEVYKAFIFSGRCSLGKLFLAKDGPVYNQVPNENKIVICGRRVYNFVNSKSIL